MGVLTRAVTLAGVSLGGWLGYQLIVQHGRLLLRIEALEQQVAQLTGNAPIQPDQPHGLAPGSVVLDFALPTLSGGTIALSQWRGRSVLLIFFDPQCHFCRQMLPQLATLEPEPTDGRPVPLIISTGDFEQNRRLIEEHAVCCTVLLQEHDEVAQLYQADGTPTAYLIDQDGKTVGPLATGAHAIMALADVAPSIATRSGSVRHTLRTRNGQAVASRINRDGLKAGTPAPSFRLPLVTGAELALEELLGRNVLLVFSDPQCAPCNELAPKLQQLHQRLPDIQLLMISRGDLEDNRAKVAAYGLTFPVVLQRHWEISRLYGMFATPIGYLIDARGIIAQDVAVGSDAILALLTTKVHRSTKRKEVSIRF